MSRFSKIFAPLSGTVDSLVHVGSVREACELAAPHNLPLDVNAIAKHTVKESDVEVVEDLDE
jgi:hypothetical protein